MSKGTTSIGIKAQFWQEIKDFVLNLGLKGGYHSSVVYQVRTALYLCLTLTLLVYQYDFSSSLQVTNV